MKTYIKEEIVEIIKNKELFKQEIIDSKGFILYLADKYKVDLSANILIDSISQYSIRYIMEDLDKKEYSSEQIAVVLNYLKEDSDYIEEEKNLNIIKNYDLSKLLEDISLGNEPPKNVNKVLKLSFEDFLENQKELCKLLDHSKDDYWRDYFNGNSTNSLLTPIFKKISKDEFIKIDKEILGKYPSLYFMAKHLMGDEDIKKSFNESVSFYHEQPDIKKSGYKPTLENYTHYEFSENEKELFISLLEHSYVSDYEKVKNYKGFNLFFSKNDYILNHDISSIEYFSKKEISENLHKIRDSIVKEYFKANYNNIEKTYRLKIDESSFKKIFNKEFVKYLVEKSNGFHFNYFDRDNPKKMNFMNIIHKTVYQLCAEDDNILNLVGFQNLVNNTVNLVENNNGFFDKEYIDSFKKILNKLDRQLSSEHIFENTNKDKIDCYLEFDIPNFIIEKMEGNESINYLYMLMKITQKKNTWKSATYIEEIKRIIPLLNKEDVILLAKNLNYKIEKKLLKNNPRQNYDNNFLNFNPEIIKNMPMDTFKEIFTISKEFRDMVIENNLDFILIEDKKRSVENNSYSSFIKEILNEVDSKKSPYFNFMKKFINKNKDFMLKNYFSELVTHPMREELIKIDTKEVEYDSYKKLESILDEYFEKNFEYDKLYNLKEGLSKKEKKNLEEKRNAVLVEKEDLSEKITELIKDISFDFYQNKIKEVDPIKAIQLCSVNIKQNHWETISNKIESLDFETTKDLLNNKNFLRFIFDNKEKDEFNRNNDKNFLYLNSNFTDKENIELVELMLKNFNDNKLFVQKYEKNISLSQILYLIDKDNRFKISNDLVVKHDPVAMFHSYDYLPKESSFFKRHVKNEFSNQQIIEAIKNINVQGKKIISVNNQNMSHHNLLEHNYENDNKDVDNPLLKDYLSLLKYLENDPMNYLACIHSDIVKNFVNINIFNSRDLAITDFYDKHINADVVIKAMKEIFNLHKEYYEDKDIFKTNEECYKGVSLKNALSAITNFIAYTYSSRSDVITSEFSEEKSKKILKTIIEEAPYLYFEYSSIGKLVSTQKEISSNFENYYNDNFIDQFFLHSAKLNISSSNFSLSYEKRKDYWQSKNADCFVVDLIQYLTLNKKTSDLYFLDFIIKEKDFNEKQRPYSKHLREYDTTLLRFVDNEEYKKLIEKSLLFIELTKSTELKEVKNKSRNKI